jgi:predicted ATPase/DNA-binding SARP family transcriptional activator
MEFGLLGPLAVWRDGEELSIAATKPRALLALLLLRANEVVSTARLIDELWGERPPARAVKTVQVYVSQLRKTLGAGVVETRTGGYLIRVDEGALDVDRFESGLERGRALLDAGAARDAGAALREALALWRGPALSDLEQESFARDEIGRLEELRLMALALRIEADLALGRHAEVTPELEALVREHPLRERLRELLVLALYRAGRQADALAAYHDARTTLVEELGLEPGQSLRELEKSILVQDRSLDLAALQGAETNLPVPPTRLIGRGVELADVTERVRRDDLRLLTLTGPGGTGKTRLALEAARELVDEFPGGVHFVALAPIADPALVLPTIAQALGLADAAGALSELLGRRSRGQQLLLVLDNFEHLDEAAPDLSVLLADAPGLTLLVTSRSPLRLQGEHEYAVPPLVLPDPARLPEADVLAHYDSVALFVERARAVKSDFELTDANAAAVAELCIRLDGLPLAIELAAARVKLLPPQALLARLEQRLDLLTGARDLPVRQQTLRAAIDWSHSLLDAEEQTLFARLAVFHGGFTLEAAEAVAGSDGVLRGLATLVDASMCLQAEQPDGERRFSMLETIRTYALERLDASGEADDLRLRHAQWFAKVDERMTIDDRFGEVDRLALDRDLGNYRAALGELAEHDPELFVRLVWNLAHGLWGGRGYITEGAAWCEKAVEVTADRPASLRARAWQCAAWFALVQNDHDKATDYFSKALEARQGDELIECARIVRWLSVVAAERGEVAKAESLSEQAMAMFREAGDTYHMFVVSHDRAIFALERGDYPSVRALLDESLAWAREVDRDDDIAAVLLDVGILELREHRYPEAAAVFGESLERSFRRGHRPAVAMSLRGLATATAAEGRLEPAARMLGAAERIDMETAWVMEPHEQATFAETTELVHGRADGTDVAAALEAGRAMSDSEAVAYALATLSEEPVAT